MQHRFDDPLCRGRQADTGNCSRPHHVRADLRVSQAYLKKRIQPLPTYSHPADTCTTVATCNFCDLTTSPTALATVPRARGSFNFADQYQITSHTDGSAYRRRGDVRGCYASTSSTAWPKVVVPSADSLVIVPCTYVHVFASRRRTRQDLWNHSLRLQGTQSRAR